MTFPEQANRMAEAGKSNWDPVACLWKSFIGVHWDQEEVRCVWKVMMLTPWLCANGSVTALGSSFHIFKVGVEQEALDRVSIQDLYSSVTLSGRGLGWGSKFISLLSLCYLWLRSPVCQLEGHLSHSELLSRKLFSVKKTLVLLSHSDTSRLSIKS